MKINSAMKKMIPALMILPFIPVFFNKSIALQMLNLNSVSGQSIAVALILYMVVYALYYFIRLVYSSDTLYVVFRKSAYCFALDFIFTIGLFLLGLTIMSFAGYSSATSYLGLFFCILILVKTVSFAIFENSIYEKKVQHTVEIHLKEAWRSSLLERVLLLSGCVLLFSISALFAPAFVVEATLIATILFLSLLYTLIIQPVVLGQDV